MSWYRDYKEQWKEIIETVAAEEHRMTQMVEKDTIQSMILSGISQSDLPFVFKGGTSLSKAYGLIDELPQHTRDFSRELGGIFLNFTFTYGIIYIWIKMFI